jgi:hypothetical protein
MPGLPAMANQIGITVATYLPEVLETVRARARFNSRPVVVFAQYSMGALFPFVGLFREACSGSS